MKKVIIAFDGKHFSEAAFDFVRSLNEKQALSVTGIFLPGIDYSELLYSLGGIGGPLFYENVETEDTGTVEKNMEHFKMLCMQNGMEYYIHKDLEKHVISQLKLESRYADLLVIGSELFYENLGKDTQDEYIEHATHNAECPVILIPEHCHFPENVILAYDGSGSSVFAIKQFAYLLPGFGKSKTVLVSVGTEDKNIPGQAYIEELVSRHFNNFSILKLETMPPRYFNTWLKENGNSILVSGAYGRSGLSEMLRKSFISETIHDHKLPIFIAHK